MGNWIPENGGFYYMDQFSVTNNVSMAIDCDWCSGEGFSKPDNL